MSIINSLTVLCILMLCSSLFPFKHEASPPVVFVSMPYYSITGLVTSDDFDKSQSSSTITHLHGWFLSFSAAMMNQIILTGDLLDVGGEELVTMAWDFCLVFYL